jgi:hypothetical protein
MRTIVAVVTMLVVACTGVPADGEGEGEDQGEGEDDGEGEGEGINLDSTEPLNVDTNPCERLDAWPYALPSALRPIVVHFRLNAHRDVAEQTINLLEQAWTRQVGDTGFRAPPSDDLGDGTFGCGEDERFDVFLFDGAETPYVDATYDIESTSHADVTAFMVLDPWGETGGDYYDDVVFHEFHHACQAADDWYDNVAIYEASAQFAEEYYFDDANVYLETIYDAQLLPEYAVDHDDNYETYFMYGQCLYLIYLHEAHFNFDIAWWPAMWLNLRSAVDEDPDYQDALNGLLSPRDSFYSSLVEYSQWRFYTGADDDGAHLSEGASMEPVARAGAVDLVANASDAVVIEPMMLGMAYIDVRSDVPFEVTLGEPPAGSQFVVSALPGDEVIDRGSIAVIDGRRTLAIVLLPTTEPYDPDERTDERFATTITITR